MVPNTGMLSMGEFQASRLRCTCLATSRRASLAPLRSNLLMATNSAKSSMSIFSSWLAAPNSGVMTYKGTSTKGTIAASPWPMPEVSTTIKSKPATLQAAITSGSAWLISLPKSRVARLRINTRAPASLPVLVQGEIAFMRMRSPSKAPPLLRREGSMEMTAMRKLSPQSRRRRRISSSVSEDLPAPPVPVMPMLGTLEAAAWVRRACRVAASTLPASTTVRNCANARQCASLWPCSALKSVGA